MTVDAADEFAWYRATTLLERRTAGPPSAAAEPAVEQDDLARYRLESWKAQAPFAAGSYFEQRLAQDGLDEPELRRLLQERFDVVRERFTESPRWLVDLEAALSQSGAPSFESLLPEELKQKPAAGFLHAAGPLIEQALARFEQGIAALVRRSFQLPFDPSTVKAILFAGLPGSLLEMLSRALVLELNIERLEGKLDGAAPEERFSSFLEHLRRPARQQTFLREYPVLARQLVERAQQWVAVSLEFLERLCLDWPSLRGWFPTATDPGALVSVDSDIADTHCGGRSVLLARFSSGDRIVYKPRSLAVDAHFQELLQWLNERGAPAPFRKLAVLDRGTHGWVEYVPSRQCATPEDVRRFYERQGAYVALLYVLEATDFHRGNLIASGEHPVLIDLEALFHPRRVRIPAGATPASGFDSAHRNARRAISQSVLRSGLLPERSQSNSENEGVHLSGLALVDGQLTPHPLPQWEQAGMDTMHLVRKRKPIGRSKNHPTLAGAPVNVRDYRDAIAEGFRSTYSLLRDHRDELLSGDGPLARFARDEVCVFLRGSRTYRRLQRESFHPDVLRDAVDRDRLFDLLWVGVEHDRDLARVIRAERHDLLLGDVPQFKARPGSCDLWTSAGECLPDFLTESSLSIVRRRVAELGDEDLERQGWFLQASLSTLPDDPSCWPSDPLTPPFGVASAERLQAAAQAVGDRLEALAVRGDGDATWIGLSLERGRSWSIVPFGMDLYGGLPGVALFLAYLGAVTGRDRYTALSRAALTALERRIERRRSSMTWIGGFDGWGGVIYALTHLGALWDRPELADAASSVVDQLPALIERDDVFDLVGGAAGCIGALRCLECSAASDRLTAAAIQCGDHLLAGAQTLDAGIGWLPKYAGPRPLAGFAHGAAGIAWSLLELHAWTGLERFRAAADQALAYERSLFVEANGNWADLREHGSPRGLGPGEQPGRMTAWCHGAAGIALARLCSLPYSDDPAARAEIAVALETTLLQGFGHNDSLCHGDLGNLELLLQASRILGDRPWQAELRRLAATLLESSERRGWRCGVPFGVETPGLMTGLAGIGYELLRLAAPESVPSLLVLEPPRSKASGSPRARRLT